MRFLVLLCAALITVPAGLSVAAADPMPMLMPPPDLPLTNPTDPAAFPASIIPSAGTAAPAAPAAPNPAPASSLSVIEEEMKKPVGVPFEQIQDKLEVSTDEYWNYQNKMMMFDLLKQYQLQQQPRDTPQQGQ